MRLSVRRSCCSLTKFTNELGMGPLRLLCDRSLQYRAKGQTLKSHLSGHPAPKA